MNVSGPVVVDVGDLKISDDPDHTIATYALGSCVAVVAYDPTLRVGGLLHFMLPDASLAPNKARHRPAMFGDTGIPRLFHALYALGCVKDDLRVWAIGGATATDGLKSFNVGALNIERVRQVLQGAQVSLVGEDLGGHQARTVHLRLGDGRVVVQTKGQRLDLTSGRRVPIVHTDPLPRPTGRAPLTRHIIAIGASTGGANAVTRVLSGLEADSPGVLITQHMPAHFTPGFAQRLDAASPLAVKEANDGDLLEPGTALLAPGGLHTVLRRDGDGYFVRVKSGPRINLHRPSVDVTFRSVARAAGADAIGVLLTGMGEDGALCLKEMHDAGATTFAQSERTCAVFGMPSAAIRYGGVDHVCDLDDLSGRLTLACRSLRKGASR